MKNLVLTLVFLFLFGAKSAPIQAKEEFFAPVCLTVNGNYVNTQNHAYLKDGVTMVPLRDIGDILGAEVGWNQNTSTATAELNNKTVAITKGKKTATVNGKSQKLAESATIVRDRIFVPLRFLAETFGANVLWNGETMTVNIKSNSATIPAHLKGEAPYTSDELYWLSKIVSAESAGEPSEGKVAVANVILNRVKSPEFPNTIYGVIFDRKYGVQFTPTADGAIYNAPTTESIIAAKRALLGEDVSRQSLYFLNPKTATNSWIIENRKYYKTIGNHDFYL